VDQWYFVEISWSHDSGLEIYIDLQKVANGQAPATNHHQLPTTESYLCVACLNSPLNDSMDNVAISYHVDRVAANVAIDELSICYGSLNKLTYFEFIQRGTYH